MAFEHNLKRITIARRLTPLSVVDFADVQTETGVAYAIFVLGVPSQAIC